MTQVEIKRKRRKAVDALKVASGENARWLRWEIDRLDAALEQDGRDRKRLAEVRESVRGRLAI